jgi:transcriptional regulator with XRE-family HTH domain
MNYFKYNLRLEREKRKLTQEDISKAVGVSRELISRWENGNRLPRIDQLMKLSETLNVPIDTLLNRKI